MPPCCTFTPENCCRFNPALTADKADKVPIQQIYGELARDERRNDLIFDDILATLDAGRSPLLITERKEHLAYFADRLSRFAKNIVTLQDRKSVV